MGALRHRHGGDPRGLGHHRRVADGGDDDDGDTSTGGGSEQAGDDGTEADDGDSGDEVAAESTTTLPPFDGWVDPTSSGEPWTAAVAAREGLLTFRGNPTRSYYGRGPGPAAPRTSCGRYPESGGMCGDSSVGSGQDLVRHRLDRPARVFERDGQTWVAFGAYDKAVHFLDGDDRRAHSCAASRSATSSRAR